MEQRDATCALVLSLNILRVNTTNWPSVQDALRTPRPHHIAYRGPNLTDRFRRSHCPVTTSHCPAMTSPPRNIRQVGHSCGRCSQRDVNGRPNEADKVASCVTSAPRRDSPCLTEATRRASDVGRGDGGDSGATKKHGRWRNARLTTAACTRCSPRWPG